MKRLFATWAVVICAMFFAFVETAQAQQNSVWIQIAAHPSRADAEARARDFAAQLPDVAGFSLGAGWFGVVLGPYTRPDAERILQVYRREGSIPRDSFIAFSRNLRAQFFPVGPIQNTAPVVAPAPTEAPAAEEPIAQTPEPAPAALPDETVSEARRSESRLTRAEREALQIAMKAQGFYTSTIDGAFGRGTRRSMADWQAANRFEPTGVLTTAQRQTLLGQYNAPLISVGMQRIEDTPAGIALDLPTKEVAFDRYESPFVQYKSLTDLGARVFLISQPGDQRTLHGLYDIMQTLEVIPLDGERKRNANDFTIEGRGKGMVTYTQATLRNGQIKGFTLIWPEGDEERRSRVLTAMQTSFTRLDGVLDPAAGADAPQNVDLLAGLQIRRPRLSHSGFFVDDRGTVITTSDVVASCSRITLDHDYEAEILLNDTANGLAVLAAKDALAPIAVAELATTTPRLQSDVAVSGFSYQGVLGAPSLTWGVLSDLKSLDGNEGVARLALAPQDGDAGGPVINNTGAVIGMLLPNRIGNQQLPDGVSFAVNADALRLALNSVDRRPLASAAEQSVPNEALVRATSGMTVLVSCWE